MTDPLPPDVQKRLDQGARAVEKLALVQERLDAVLDQLAENEREMGEAGIAGDLVVGRPSLADFRRKAREVVRVLDRLPAIRRKAGLGAVRHKVGEAVLQDLALLDLEAPRGIHQVQERDRIRRMLTHPGLQEVLSADTPSGDYFRTLLATRIDDLFVRPSSRRVFDKSSEHFPDEKGGRRR